MVRKLCAKFQVSRCTGRWHSPLSLQSVLQGVLEDILDSWMDSRSVWISKIKCINIKEALWKISRSSMSLQGILQGVLEDILYSWMESDDFGDQEWHIYKHKGSSVQFYTYMCTGRRRSSLRFQSVLQGVLEDILDSLMESNWLWTLRMTCINIKKAVCKISGPSGHLKGTFS